MSFESDARERLARIEEKIDTLVDKGRDTESRLRGLEKWKAALPIALLIAVGSVVGDVVIR